MGSLDVDGDGKISVQEFSIAFMNRKVSSQQERMWKVFQKIDKNNDGVLDRNEIKQALASNVHSSELDKIIKEVDKDGNGKIEYSEFLEAWRGVESKKLE